MDIPIVAGFTLMIVGPAVALLGLALRPKLRWLVVLSGLLVIDLAWGLDIALTPRVAGDLEGAFDCWTACSATQNAAEGLLFYLPAFMGAFVLGCVAGLAGWWSVRKAASGSRRARGSGPPAPSRR
jgi:hypothetical protein